MPPKRRPPAPPPPQEPKKRRSKLAKENNLTAEQEGEIQEAFSLFAIQHPDFDDEKEGVLKTEDVRRCLIALGISLSASELPEIVSTLDPTETGFVPYSYFLPVAALHLNNHSSEDRAAEVHAAYALFTKGGAGPITIAHLRRVARELREEVSDDVLRDMILEANGGSGNESVGKGVGLEEFEGVMKRAGVFG